MNKNYYRVLIFSIGIFLITLGTFLGLNIAENSIKEEISIKPVKEEIEQPIISKPVLNNINKDFEITEVIIYEDCEDEIVNVFSEYDTTIEKLREKYKGEYEISEEQNNSLTITKNVEGSCTNHFLLKILNDTVAIYNIVGEDEIKLYKTTDIYVESLRNEMKEVLKTGIILDSLEDLNSMIEDLES